MAPIEPNADYDKLNGILNLSGPGFYLQIHISPDELEPLAEVEGASWEQRTSIKAGQSLGKPVFWCRSREDPTAVTVLVGPDDETWELALEVPVAVVLAALS